MKWPKAGALCFHQTWYSPPRRAPLLLSRCGVGRKDLGNKPGPPQAAVNLHCPCTHNALCLNVL